jgi:hypothetical protein
LLLGLVTGGLFALAWLFVQANFIKRIDGSSKARELLTGVAAADVVYIGLASSAAASASNAQALASYGPLLLLAGFVLGLVAVFSMRRSLVDYYNSVEPIYLRLNEVMTFFFHVLYFQHHLTRIAQWKQTGTLAPQ